MEVFDKNGKSLGEEWLDLSNLQNETKCSMIHTYELDNSLEKKTQKDREYHTLTIVDDFLGEMFSQPRIVNE